MVKIISALVLDRCVVCCAVFQNVHAETAGFFFDLQMNSFTLFQCFPNFFVFWHSKKAKQIFRRNCHMNPLILIVNCITCDSEKGDCLFLWSSLFFRAT